jgi:hypothetical protein
MANQDPLANMQAQLAQLQGELTILQNLNTTLQTQFNTIQNAGAAQQQAQVQQNPPQAATFAVTPATSNLSGLLDYYSRKIGEHTQGCKKLTKDKAFPMIPALTAAFVKVFENCCTIMGWNQGAQGFIKLQKATSIAVDIVKYYGQINKATLKTFCDVFCKAGGQIFRLKRHDGTVPQEQCHHCRSGSP